MKVQEMLRQLALRCEQDGPIRRQQDAATILSMVDALDEDAARTYLERFVDKWRLAPAREEHPAHSPLARRRPMSDLERRVYLELVAGGARATEPEVEITVDPELEGIVPPAEHHTPH